MDDLTRKIESGFKFLILSRTFRSVAIIYVTLSLPLYLLSLNVRILVVGILFFAMISVSVVISLFAGMLGDRIGYKYSLIIADIPLIIATFLLFTFHSVEAIEIATIVGGIGGAPGGLRGVFVPGMLAMIARNWPETPSRVHKMGMLMSVGSFASIGGSVLLYAGGFLLPGVSIAVEYRTFYVLTFVLAILSAIFVYLTPERKGERKKRVLMRRSSGRYTGKVVATNLIQGSGLGLGIVLLPAWLYLRYGVSSSTIGLIFTVSYATTAVGSLVSSLLPTRDNPIVSGSVSRLLQGVMLALLAFMPTALLATVVYSARQFFGGYGAPIRSAINVRGIRNEDFGTASSIQGLGMRAGQSTSVLSGYLMEISLPVPELLGGIMQCISGYVYYKLLRGNSPETGSRDSRPPA